MIKNPVKKSITFHFHFHSFRSFKVSLIKLKKNKDIKIRNKVYLISKLLGIQRFLPKNDFLIRSHTKKTFDLLWKSLCL